MYQKKWFIHVLGVFVIGHGSRPPGQEERVKGTYPNKLKIITMSSQSHVYESDLLVL